MSGPMLPEIDEANRSFWTGGRDGHLMIHRCASCRTWIHPPVPYCSACGGRDVAPQPVSGRGRVTCFTFNDMAWIEGDSEWQRIVAVVELDEQPELHVLTNVVDCAEADVHTGLPVEVAFRQFDDVYLPVFRPQERS